MKGSACCGPHSSWLGRGGEKQTLTMLQPPQTWQTRAGWLTSTPKQKPSTWRFGALMSPTAAKTLLQSLPVCACASSAFVCINSLAGHVLTATVGLQAIQLLAQSLGNDDRRTAAVMQQLATHYWARGNWEAGEVCATSHSYRRAAKPFRERVC